MKYLFDASVVPEMKSPVTHLQFLTEIKMKNRHLSNHYKHIFTLNYRRETILQKNHTNQGH